MSSIYSIYKATNTITGKCYIGFDSNWPNRQRDHKKESSQKKSKLIFHKAIRKYGWNNFEWSILYQSLDGDHCLNVMEKYFIAQNNSHYKLKSSNGYNMTFGGEGTQGYKHKSSSIEKIKISSSNMWSDPLSIVNSETYKERRRCEMIEVMNNLEVRKKISETLSQFWIITNPNGDTVTIKNLVKYCEENNLTRSLMSKVASGKRKHHKGFKCSKL